METSIRNTLIYVTDQGGMEVSYFFSDIPAPSLSGMVNLQVTSAINEIPTLVQTVPKNIRDDETFQLRAVNDLVRGYLLATNRVPYANISFQLNGETVVGSLAGSDIWWTFTSESPEFLKYFRGGSVRINTLFIESPAPEILEMMQMLTDRAASLSWKGTGNSAASGRAQDPPTMPQTAIKPSDKL